jgi:cytochrome P450 family 6
MFSNAFALLTAGTETTSTSLAYCTYRLAAHSIVQDDIYKEIIKYWSLNVDYYDLVTNKLTKLDNFVREVFRMHPIVVQVINRECMEDTRIGGYNIEKGNIALYCCQIRKQLYLHAGSLVQVDLQSINFNQELWGPEPVDEFHPERHLRKRHPLADMTFGAGPRQCLGMRFALSEFLFFLIDL